MDVDERVDVGIGVGTAASPPVGLSFNPRNHINPTIKISTKITRGALSANEFGTAKPWLRILGGVLA